MDLLFVIRKGAKTGTFKNLNLTTRPGDVCLCYPFGINPGTGEVWKSGRFGYALIKNQPLTMGKLMCGPAYYPFINVDQGYIMKHKRRYAVPQIIYSALSEDYDSPTLLSLSDISEDKDNV